MTLLEIVSKYREDNIVLEQMELREGDWKEVARRYAKAKLEEAGENVTHLAFNSEYPYCETTLEQVREVLTNTPVD